MMPRPFKPHLILAVAIVFWFSSAVTESHSCDCFPFKLYFQGGAGRGERQWSNGQGGKGDRMESGQQGSIAFEPVKQIGGSAISSSSSSSLWLSLGCFLDKGKPSQRGNEDTKNKNDARGVFVRGRQQTISTGFSQLQLWRMDKRSRIGSWLIAGVLFALCIVRAERAERRFLGFCF